MHLAQSETLLAARSRRILQATFPLQGEQRCSADGAEIRETAEPKLCQITDSR
jgi:hypothetical protein